MPDQFGRVHNQPGAGAFDQPVVLKVPGHAGKPDQHRGRCRTDTCFLHQDLHFPVWLGVGKIQRDKPLPRALFQVLENALVTGVVGNGQTEFRRRFQQFTQLFYGQETPVVTQGVNDYRRVLPGLDDLIQVTDGAATHRPRQRAVNPDSLPTLDQVAPDQVGSGQIIMAGYRDHGPVQAPAHVFHEPGFAATGGALQQNRQSVISGRLKYACLVAGGLIIRLLPDGIFFKPDRVGAHWPAVLTS